LLRFNSPCPTGPAAAIRHRDAKRLFHSREIQRERTAAKKLAAEYFQRFPKERYQTEVE